MLGTLLNGRYKLLRLLGSGGFGQTFVAEDTQQEREGFLCVVKQLKPISRDEMFLTVARRLFLNEVEMLRKLGSHDRIPSLIDKFEEDGQFYLVQELIEGRSLAEEFKIYRTLTEPQVVSLVRNVAEILEFVHQENIIHRDIKPSNLIRRYADGKLVLIDFGAVKELNTHISTEIEPTRLTVGIATEGYGPSEQLAGKPRFNSDLYALGMTAIQALTGLHPSQLPTHPMTGEVIWHDRADVSPWFVDILTKMVRYHFNDRFQSATEVLAALDQTARLQPTDVQEKAAWDAETLVPPSTLGTLNTEVLEATSARPTVLIKRWNSRVAAPFLIGLVGLLTTGSVAVMRQIGWLEPLELAAFDRIVQLSPQPSPDPRILVVGITEADIQAQKRFPLADEVVAQTMQKLQVYKPRAIGLDLFRDIPQEPGRAKLLDALKAPNTIAILNLDDPITPAPPEVPPERVGFNDVPLDADSIVRRNLLIANLPEHAEPFYSFALRLAMMYLKQENVTLKPSPTDPNIAQLGAATLVPLNPQSGGYQNVDDRGYQIMMQFRGKDAIQQVSLAEVLSGALQPQQVQDRIVLIGTTAANAKDLFLTPYSPTTSTPRMAGVVIHAHMVSQLISLGMGEKTPIWYWTPTLEIVWIAGWATLAAIVTWRLTTYPFLLFLANGILVVGLLGAGYGLFLWSGWVPMAAPAIAIPIASLGIVTFRQKPIFKGE
jgi:CHASE2 domain-containing sensor protein/tRNA A-37 threonylcarbamoyl transferase component Bud32